MNTTARRAFAAVLMTAATLVPLAGAAHADSTPADLRTWGLSTDLQQRTSLVEAVDDARAGLRTSVQSARSALRAAVDGVRLQVLTESASQRAANRARHDRELSMAVAAARSSLQTARSTYTNALTSAFATWAPGSSLPRNLTETASWSGIGDGTWLDLERLRAVVLPRS